MGDRRDVDNIELGRIAAKMFDKVVIKEDSDLRGKSAGETTEIVKIGIANSPFNPTVVTIANEKQALQFAMKNASPGTLIMHCVENIEEVISLMKKKEREQPYIRSRHLKHSIQRAKSENEISVGINI